MDDLQKLYNENNFPPKKRLYKLARDAGLKYTLKQVNEFVDKQIVHQLTSKYRNPKVFSSVVAPGVNATWNIDLVIYDRFKIHNYQYILNCVDIHSRFAYGVALTRKDRHSVIEGMKKVFEKYRDSLPNYNY